MLWIRGCGRSSDLSGIGGRIRTRALVSAAANEVSAPIETSDQESEQPAPIEAITAPESEASSDQAEEVITPESEASSEQKEAAETPPLLDAKQISWDL
ncbi:hypothetical protein F4054_18985 [Candidatus Poribacteria bacterium]|nr:hypothetical protein [Candidatus Poribacteria bacterium]MYK24328.1 hypothetical protein [Candidatus Poribacteria bacterium]